MCLILLWCEGDGMWNDIQAEIQNVENIHNNLKNIAAQKKNL